VRSALRLLLEQDLGLSLVDEAAEAAELLDRLQATCPDLLLLDWEVAGRQGDGLMLAIGRCCPALSVIVLSGRAALAAGADAFVSKGDPPERLLAVMDGCGRQRCG
jgi:DNA-binding NarL/FixJ family response regulator